MFMPPQLDDMVLVTGGADVGVKATLLCFDGNDLILKESNESYNDMILFMWHFFCGACLWTCSHCKSMRLCGRVHGPLLSPAEEEAGSLEDTGLEEETEPEEEEVVAIDIRMRLSLTLSGRMDMLR